MKPSNSSSPTRSIALGVTVAVAIAGCSDEPAASNQEAEIASNVVLAAKLYGDPAAEPTPGCDLYTQLTISKTGSGKYTLALEDMLAGGCERVAPPPNRRTYPVTQRADSQKEFCGATIFEGASYQDSVQVVDFRKFDRKDARCQDARPLAPLHLEENVEEQPTLKLYGSP